MKKVIAILSALLMVLPAVIATDVGTSIGIDIITEDFEPKVWLCDDRVVLDDNVQPGRMCPLDHEGDPVPEECEWEQKVSSYEVEGAYLVERLANYAFEGEQIVWDVIVFDKNGIEKVQEVFVTVGDTQGDGNDVEVNCILDEMIPGWDDNQQDEEGVVEDQDDTFQDGEVWEECNARIGEEWIKKFSDNTAAKYKCILTVETPESMYDEYWVTVEAIDLDGLSGTMDENEYWFFNPVIALSIDGSLTFDDVRPGSSAYSSTLLLGNDADAGSGVLLDMFISGTDFYDSESSGAKCPLTNQLKLGDGDSDCDVSKQWHPKGDGWEVEDTDPFCYFATNGAYSSQGDHRNGPAEDYVGINYGTSFGNSPQHGDFYGASNGDSGGYEIIQSSIMVGPYFAGNILSPGSEMALTFRLNLPEPCNGDFDTGSLYFFGEAV